MVFEKKDLIENWGLVIGPNPQFQLNQFIL
jgi:hypothetical protein